MSKKLLSLLSACVVAGSTFAQESVFPELDVNLYDEQALATDPNTILIPASTIQYDVLFIGGTVLYTTLTQDNPLLLKNGKISVVMYLLITEVILVMLLSIMSAYKLRPS